jgi:broad specificity phosphatase PhoE
MVLTPLGAEQAESAGEWLRKEFPDGFDHYYVSSLLRTIQTAGSLALQGADWIIDDRFRERDWGEVAPLSDEQHKERFPESYRSKQLNKWYWCPPGGESLGTGVRLRWERILNTMNREQTGHDVIAVTHGEMIEVGRVVLERLLVPEWIEQESDSDYKLANCQIIHYTRLDPETGKDAGKLLWRRSICPYDDTKSWFGGDWQRFDPDRRFSNAELLAMARESAPLFPELAQSYDRD